MIIKTLLVACLIGGTTAFADRTQVTQVYVVNFASHPLDIKVHSNDLSSQYWDIDEFFNANKSRYSSNGAYISKGNYEVLERLGGQGRAFPIIDLSRSIGITHGKNFHVYADIYYTRPNRDDKKILLAINLTGTPFGSDIEWSVTISGGTAVDHIMGDWFSDRSSRTIKFQDGDKKYKVEFHLSPTFEKESLWIQLFQEDAPVIAKHEETQTDQTPTDEIIIVEPIIPIEPETPAEPLIPVPEPRPEPEAPDVLEPEEPDMKIPAEELGHIQ